jgi:predicted phage-related endonuclease
MNLDEILDYNIVPDSKGDQAWHQQRLGKLTSSRFADMMAEGRAKNDKYGVAAMKYIYEKIAEQITLQPHIVTSQATDWGTQMEYDAIQKYEDESGNKVHLCGFVEFGESAGGTPDGLVGNDGIIEVKCPFNPANHVETFLEKKVPKQYVFQIQGNLMVTDRKWCDFVSYDPRVTNDKLQLFVLRVERDEEIISAIKERIIEVSEKIKELTKTIPT